MTKNRLASAAVVYVMIGAAIMLLQHLTAPAECDALGALPGENGAKLSGLAFLAWPYHLYRDFVEDGMTVAQVLAPTTCVDRSLVEHGTELLPPAGFGG